MLCVRASEHSHIATKRHPTINLATECAKSLVSKGEAMTNRPDNALHCTIQNGVDLFSNETERSRQLS